MNRVMYREWFPQIVYNHHQTGPAGRGAVHARLPRSRSITISIPLVINGIDGGRRQHDEAITSPRASPAPPCAPAPPIQTWFNGGLSTTCHFHNMIGLFTETIGSPTPTHIRFMPDKLLPNSRLPRPRSPPQTWHFRQSVEYSVSGNKAVLDYASRNREQLLYNIWRMGKNCHRRAATAIAGRSRPRSSRQPAAAAWRWRRIQERRAAGAKEFERLFHNPDKRDPRGYIIPADQPDFLTATKFINALLGTGVTVHRASADFRWPARSTRKGSYVVKTAQAFRPHVLDMFEPQDHPDDFAC